MSEKTGAMDGMENNYAGIGREPDGRRGPGPNVMGAETLIGNPVHNHRGEDLGDIKEIMLDMHTGKVGYAVLSFGGFLGIGEKLFAVPWDALMLNTKKKHFVLNLEREYLKHAPGFDRDEWPLMANQSWIKEIQAYDVSPPYSDDILAQPTAPVFPVR